MQFEHRDGTRSSGYLRADATAVPISYEIVGTTATYGAEFGGDATLLSFALESLIEAGARRLVLDLRTIPWIIFSVSISDPSYSQAELLYRTAGPLRAWSTRVECGIARSIPVIHWSRVQRRPRPRSWAAVPRSGSRDNRRLPKFGKNLVKTPFELHRGFPGHNSRWTTRMAPR